jgi:predicted DNA-binding transcriptional regulator AlpA
MSAQGNKVEPDVHPRSVRGFCKRHGFCVATFYNLAKRGEAPALMKVGARSIITEQAEAEWLRKMQVRAA